MNKQKSKTRVIRDECNGILNQIPHNLTKKSYKQIVRRYVNYCRREFDVQTFEECKGYIQTYCDYLQNEGYTASSIHTYISGIVSVGMFRSNLLINQLDTLVNTRKAGPNIRKDTVVAKICRTICGIISLNFSH